MIVNWVKSLTSKVAPAFTNLILEVLGKETDGPLVEIVNFMRRLRFETGFRWRTKFTDYCAGNRELADANLSHKLLQRKTLHTLDGYGSRGNNNCDDER